jgi:hypothetical protein
MLNLFECKKPTIKQPEKNQTLSNYNSRETDHQNFNNFDLTLVSVSGVL